MDQKEWSRNKEPRVWERHPDLEEDWNHLITESRKTASGNLNSDLWINFWRCQEDKVPITTTSSQDTLYGINEGKPPTVVVDISDEKEDIPTYSSENAGHEKGDVSLTDSQLKQLDGILLELLDALDMATEGIPDELRDDISSLSRQALIHLLKELSSQLSDQGAYHFCTLLCNNINENPWVNIPLVFEAFCLPLICGDRLKSLGEEVKAGLKQLAGCYPSECSSFLLKPLLVKEPIMASHIEFLSGLLPSLPERDFTSLLRFLVKHLTSPLQDWEVSVLCCLLSESKVGLLETKDESPLLELLPVMIASSRKLSNSEQFANLLLKLILALKSTATTSVRNDLISIVHQNNSFNKQALMNTLKSLGW